MGRGEGDPRGREAEEAQEEGDLGGLRPGSVYFVKPGANQLWWKPCLKRAEDSTREHCWFLAPTNYPSLFCWKCRGVRPPLWAVSHKYDRAGARLADGHYSRRTPGSPQFMPPGETLVLVTPSVHDAVFGWWRPHPAAGLESMNGLDGWTCSIFRNTGPILSSKLVLEAEIELVSAERRGDLAGPCGPDGMITYVWPRKIRSTNPGYCFQLAGWVKAGWNKTATPGRRKRLLRKPMWLAGVAACEWVPREPSQAWLEARAAVVATPMIARAG